MMLKLKEEKIKNPLPPISRQIHLLLREYCLRKTREEGHLVTQGEIIEKAILNLINSNLNHKNKGD